MKCSTHRKMLYQTDEIDHLLRCLSSTKETYYSMLLGLILEMYTEADETHVKRSKAKDQEPGPRGLRRGRSAGPGDLRHGHAGVLLRGDEPQAPDQRPVLPFDRRRCRRARPASSAPGT